MSSPVDRVRFHFAHRTAVYCMSLSHLLITERSSSGRHSARRRLVRGEISRLSESWLQSAISGMEAPKNVSACLHFP